MKEDPRVEQLLLILANIDQGLGMLQGDLPHVHQEEWVTGVRRIIGEVLAVNVELPKDIKP